MLPRIVVPAVALALLSSAPRPAAPPRDGAPEARPHVDPLADTLIALEKRSWQAWQQRDGAFFETFLSDDHVEVGFGGVTRKPAVVTGVASSACVVRSFAVDRFELTRLTETTALLTYHAAQETLCNGRPVPSPVWANSVYVRRGGRWLNAAYQQTQALGP